MIIALIPARYNSTRLPGKPLLKFGNKSMIQMVYERTNESKLIDITYVVTDDERIKDNIESINGNVLMVKDDCLNGTERLCLAINRNPEIFRNSNLIVNVQGDEPFIKPEHIDIAVSKMRSSWDKSTDLICNNIVCSTLHYCIKNRMDLDNKSIGKLVLDNHDNILYCSRTCIPYNKTGIVDLEKNLYYGHIGLFVFNKEYLLQHYTKENTKLQKEEDIEWLKIIEQGFKINSTCIEDYEIGVNNQEDYTYLYNKYIEKIEIL